VSSNTIGEDSEEAYSPSAIQFSDDESTGMEGSKSLDETDASVTKMNTQKLHQDTFNIVPSETKQDNSQDISTIKPPVVESEPIKIVLKKPAQPSLVNSSSVTVPVSRVEGDILDLVDDGEPPPPGEAVSGVSLSSSSVSAPIKSLPPLVPLSKKALNDDDESGVFASKSSTPPVSTPKGSLGFKSMKININLTTKQLPTKSADEKKSELTASPVLVDTTKAVSVPNPLSAKPSFSFGNTSNPAISIPVHLPPPSAALKSVTPMGHLPNSPNIQVPPPNMMQPLPMIPVHIPPPGLASSNAVPATSSVVINLNIPPPPISQARGAPIQPLGPGQHMPSSFPPRPPGFSGVTFPTLIPGMNPTRPNFPLFNNAAESGSVANSSTADEFPSRRTAESDAISETDRVTRVNLDREPNRRDTRNRNSSQGGRDFRGRASGFGRRTFDRRRGRSRSPDRNRSR